ncbi:MAG: DJ-1/PfpI family protein [Alphaproteobacteria bacterium]|nr:DJ-1/PfpI family protein [Alphaproteobacteria bacterium]
MHPKGLWRDPRSGIFYLRRRIPLPLQSAFDCGQLYKVSLGTADPRDAERKLAIANGEFEQKCDQFRATLANGVAGSFTSDEARVLVDRLLTARSANGFASGAMDVVFFLKELDDAVADQAGDHRSTAQDMGPAEWIAYRKNLAGSDHDDEFSPETLARIEAHHASVHRDPGELWFSFQKREPRRRWRPLLSFAVAKIKRELKLPEEANRGIDEPLADALADALGSAQVREQIAVLPSARRRANSSRLQPDMKLDALEARWIAARKPTLKAQAAMKTALRYFKSYIGDVGIGEITPNDLFEFRDAVPNYSVADAPRPDIVVIPAMDIDQVGPTVLDWLREVHKTTQVTMSVCNGSYVLAKAGLLDGRTATAHHRGFGMLRAMFPAVNVIRGKRWVEDGRLATSGGLTSGQDLAMRVVERYFGRAAAKKTARQLEYRGQGWMVPR